MLEIERKLLDLRKQQKDIGVTTISFNRLPIFQPTLKAKYKEWVFEDQHKKVSVRGRLGQNHKSLLEAILYLRKLYDFDKENMRLRVLYSEHEVRKYLTQYSKYSHEWYIKLMEDMMHTSILVQKDKMSKARAGTLIEDKRPSNNYKCKSKSNLPAMKGAEVPYAIIEFGEAVSYLFSEEFKFTYDPRPILALKHGISQALVRYIKTFTRHPPAGYHLRTLLENLLQEELENKRWWKIREYLKEDAEMLASESIGIVIDFKKDRVFVVNKKFIL